jgi:20S proteasome alpha/beta subunit
MITPFQKPHRRSPLIWRLPWRRRMTLCIAVECRGGNVILASDFRGEVGFTSAENQNKLVWVEDTWPVLIAGTVPRAYDLVATINREFAAARKARKVVDKSTVPHLLREACRRQKYELANTITAREFGISYGTFLKNGKEFLSEKAFEDVETSIRLQELDCDLIFVFFDERKPYLFQICGETVEVDEADNFCCIGTGSDLANASLFSREQNYDQALRTSLYRVVEAASQARRAPGVGEQFAVSVFHQDRRRTIVWQRVTDRGMDRLVSYVSRFGPRRIRGVRFDVDTMLETFDESEPPKSEGEDADS